MVLPSCQYWGLPLLCCLGSVHVSQLSLDACHTLHNSAMLAARSTESVVRCQSLLQSIAAVPPAENPGHCLHLKNTTAHQCQSLTACVGPDQYEVFNCLSSLCPCFQSDPADFPAQLAAGSGWLQGGAWAMPCLFPQAFLGKIIAHPHLPLLICSHKHHVIFSIVICPTARRCNLSWLAWPNRPFKIPAALVVRLPHAAAAAGTWSNFV